MKRIIAVIASVLIAAGVSLSAQNNAILQKIEKAGAAFTTIEATFTQTRTIKASGNTTVSKGNLSVNAPSQLAMMYSQPAGEMLIINGDMIHMNRGGKATTYDSAKISSMKTLRNTLMDCITGKTSKVAADNDASMTVSDTKDGYLVTIKANNASPRGYSSISLLYRKSDCVVTKMILDEFSGIRTVYDMAGIKLGTKVDSSKFNIPSR
jgi:outer membrane lipoprotein-sorting protein